MEHGGFAYLPRGHPKRRIDTERKERKTLKISAKIRRFRVRRPRSIS